MPKNITQLPSTLPQRTNVVYHSDGVNDFSCTVGDILDLDTDLGALYEPSGTITFSTTPTTLTYQTDASANANTFTLNAASGEITFGANAVGRGYDVAIQFISPRGFANNVEAQIVLEVVVGGTPVVVDVIYVANTASQEYASLSASTILTPTAPSTVVTARLTADATSSPVTPSVSQIVITRIA